MKNTNTVKKMLTIAFTAAVMTSVSIHSFAATSNNPAKVTAKFSGVILGFDTATKNIKADGNTISSTLGGATYSQNINATNGNFETSKVNDVTLVALKY